MSIVLANVLILEKISGQKNSCFDHGENVETLPSYIFVVFSKYLSISKVSRYFHRNFLFLNQRYILEIRYFSPWAGIMRCIHIGLLCVQESLADRPTMASVILMFNSYSLNLPVPSKPAFLMYISVRSRRNVVSVEVTKNDDASLITESKSSLKLED
ncbi:putative non-specific serine/threonine protein kinase [Rosa chinensis]|uniref:Putative non-specific serine/threonine protein kinase n=1 Tax=Rosa chinensis TaxID=74649 RepID=A0A2P6RQS7_ROSCH|nr:putative non-specific serine/threonine protein kinase [Rosa chinensis]